MMYTFFTKPAVGEKIFLGGQNAAICTHFGVKMVLYPEYPEYKPLPSDEKVPYFYQGAFIRKFGCMCLH